MRQIIADICHNYIIIISIIVLFLDYFYLRVYVFPPSLYTVYIIIGSRKLSCHAGISLNQLKQLSGQGFAH